MIGMRLRVQEDRQGGEGTCRRKDAPGEGMPQPGAPGLCCWHTGIQHPGEPWHRRVRLNSPCREAEGKARCQSPYQGWWAPRRDFCQLSKAALLVPTLPAAREGGAPPTMTARERVQSAASMPARSKLHMQSRIQRPSPAWLVLAAVPSPDGRCRTDGSSTPLPVVLLPLSCIFPSKQRTSWESVMRTGTPACRCKPRAAGGEQIRPCSRGGAADLSSKTGGCSLIVSNSIASSYWRCNAGDVCHWFYLTNDSGVWYLPYL